jgi:hypothetical protein
MPRAVTASSGWHWITRFRASDLALAQSPSAVPQIGKPLKEFTGGESGKTLSQRKYSYRNRRTLHPPSKPFHMKDALRCSPAEPH